MYLLLKAEKKEEFLIREFLYYYDGRLAGSWNDENKTLIKSFGNN